MNNLIRTANDNMQPAQSFSGLVDQLFENNLNRFFDDSLWSTNSRPGAKQVPVNIHELDTAFELEMVAPGCKKEDFKIDIANDVLTVSMEHNEEDSQQDKKHNFIRREYRRQSFSRSFKLDNTINAGNIVAKYEDGLLRITLPKKEEAQKISKSITIE